MLRNVSAAFLIVLINLPLLLKIGLAAHFAWNRQQIIAEQCINRKRPQLKCNGKCYLSRQFQKIDRPVPLQQTVPPEKLLEKLEPTAFVFPQPAPAFERDAALPTARRGNFEERLLADQNVVREMLKPPVFLV